MRELFVYYRVPQASAGDVRTQVKALHAELGATFPQLRMRLLHRAEAATGEQTWMETYAFDPAAGSTGVTDALQARIEAAAARWITVASGPRHVEAFVVEEAGAACVS